MSASSNLADLQAKIAKHAWEDPAFEAEFMANPKAVLEKQVGASLPEGLRVHAHHNTPTELHFVIPKRPVEGSELDDADLERVAGGNDIVITISAITIVIDLPPPISLSI